VPLTELDTLGISEVQALGPHAVAYSAIWLARGVRPLVSPQPRVAFKDRVSMHASA